MSTLTEYFVYPAFLFNSVARVRKEDTFESTKGYERISPVGMFVNASFKPSFLSPYFCLG